MHISNITLHQQFAKCNQHTIQRAHYCSNDLLPSHTSSHFSCNSLLLWTSTPVCPARPMQHKLGTSTSYLVHLLPKMNRTCIFWNFIAHKPWIFKESHSKDKPAGRRAEGDPACSRCSSTFSTSPSCLRKAWKKTHQFQTELEHTTSKMKKKWESGVPVALYSAHSTA